MKENNVVYLLGNLEREVRGMMSFQLNQLLDLNYWQQVISTDFLSKDFVINIIDILVVWYLVYKLIMLVRGTKAVQLLKGVAVFIIIRILSEIIGLHTLWCNRRGCYFSTGSAKRAGTSREKFVFPPE